MMVAMLVAARFCGPPDSGNGGYTSGLLASQLGGVVEVTLRRPPPLDRELELQLEGAQAWLRDGADLVAEAKRAKLDVMPPKAVSFERAGESSAHYVGHTRHHFPTCFVCGPGRAVGDGLRIFPGQARLDEPMAAPWIPAADLGDEHGKVRPEIRWAALDCVGYFSIAAPDYPVALLGRMTAELYGSVSAGERCVVQGWPVAREGRKLQAGTALYGEDGTLRGLALQTWILLQT
jgi:hypothetical protein